MKADADILGATMAKADENIAVAQIDLGAGFHGAAASHAYYAAFHAATGALATRGLSFSSHMQVIGAFNREFVGSGMFPANTIRTLRKLFDDRQTADYALGKTIDQQTATENLAAAQAIIEACRKIIEACIIS